MRELLLLKIEGESYGVWKEEIVSVKDVETLHRLPLSPACIAGMSIIDDRLVTLADLPVCIGRGAASGNGESSILMLPGREKITGFVVGREMSTLSIPLDAVFDMPDYLKTDVIHSCAIFNNHPIPLINIANLYKHLLQADQDPPRAAFALSDASALSETSGVRIFRLGRDLYAASSSQFEARAMRADRIAQLPLVPEYVKGIAFHDKTIMPVIDLCQRVNREGTQSTTMLVGLISGVTFGFLVDEDQGEKADLELKDLPAIAQSRRLKRAVMHAGKIIPFLELPALLSMNQETPEKRRLDELYLPDSAFTSQFKKQDVDVVEFSLLGARHALPRTEVEDIVPLKPFRTIPDVPQIVIGVTEHEQALLPVLDLAMVFGRRSLATLEWRMMLVKNGDFRAFVITEKVFNERRLPLDTQRTVPIHLPHNVVYGCYPDLDAVRLIFNIEAIAVHFEKSLVQGLMSALSQEMKQAPSQIVHGLLDEGVPDGVADSAERKESQIYSEPAPVSDNPSVSEISSESAEVEPVGNLAAEENICLAEAQETISSPQEDLQDVLVEQVSASIETADAEPEETPDPEIMSPLQVEEAQTDVVVEEPAPAQEEVKASVAISETEADFLEENIPSEETAGGEDQTEQTAVIQSVGEESLEKAEAASGSSVSVEETLQEPGEPIIQEEPKASVPEEAYEQTPEPEPEIAIPEPPLAAAEEKFQQEEEQLSSRDYQYQEEVLTVPAAPDSPFEKTGKRRPAYAAIAAVLIALLWITNKFETTPVQTAKQEVTPPARVETVAAEKKAPKAIEKPRASLVLEIPASMPVNIDVYTVIEGDTLWSISKRFTGNPFNYPKIAGENRIANPDLIFPGQNIRLVKK